MINLFLGTFNHFVDISFDFDMTMNARCKFLYGSRDGQKFCKIEYGSAAQNLTLVSQEAISVSDMVTIKLHQTSTSKEGYSYVYHTIAHDDTTMVSVVGTATGKSSIAFCNKESGRVSKSCIDFDP